MPLRLPPGARGAAMRYITSFPKITRAKGEDYYRSNRVLDVKDDGGGSYVAHVRGSRVYEAEMVLDDEGWYGVCDCPMGQDCKHSYAVLLYLLDRAEKSLFDDAEPVSAPKPEAKTIALPRAPEPGRFRTNIEERLGRKLAPTEAKYCNSVQSFFQQWGTYQTVPESSLLPLLVRSSSQYGWGWRQLKLWPQPPATALEAWLYLLYHFRQKALPHPQFISEVTPEAEVDALVNPWLRAQAVDQWLSFLAKEENAVQTGPSVPMELRAVFGDEGVTLESREGDASWAPVKKTKLIEMERAWDAGSLNVTPDSRRIFSAWLSSNPTGATVAYGQSAADTVSELLRDPLLVGSVVDISRLPIHRAAEPLRWHLRPPQSEDPEGDYTMLLRLPDGSAPLPPRMVLDGTPGLYITPDVIYEAPPFVGLSADPVRGNRIPAPALETSGGVALLDRLGLELPERLATRVERHLPQFVIECRLEDRETNPKGEYLLTRFYAEWGEAAPAESWTPEGWEAAEERAKGKRPRPQAETIVRLDRGPLRRVSELANRLNSRWNYLTQGWERKTGKKFAEEFSDWLLALPPEAELRLDPALASLRDDPISATVSLQVEPTGMDWFDVSTVIDTAGVELTAEERKALLSARGGWVRLGAKGWRRLALKFSEEDDAHLAELGLVAGDLSGEPQRLHALQLAHESASRLLPADQAATVRRRAEELRANVAPPVPAAITAELRPYQVDGFHFLAYLTENNFGGILADDMGLGKTLQTLCWLAWLRERPGFSGAASLVVCPKSVMDNWHGEAARFVPGLRVLLWTGGGAEALEESCLVQDVIVMNYAQLRILSETTSKHHWHVIILDEAQAIKNPDAQTARAACALKADHRLALSGTPVENRLLDLWSLMAFAMPGILGPRTRFARTYDRPGDVLARRRLSARVRPFLLRRTKGQVARDLPPKVEEELLCEMEGKQATLYRAELKRAQAMLLKLRSEKDLDRSRFHVLTSLLRLRQICCHPALVDTKATKIPSAKLEALLDLLEPLVEEGHKVLVFSQFVTLLEIVRDAMVERQWPYFMLTGETENRGDLVREFQAKEGGAVFLLSLKAGGFGLNLTAASYVVLFDPWWNPAVENQAIDRTHRIGQQNTVNAYRLLVKGSIEEKIRALQRDKRALADEVLGEETFARGLTLNDLRFLFTE